MAVQDTHTDLRDFITGATDLLQGAKSYREFLVTKLEIHDVGGDHPDYEYQDTLYRTYKNALTHFDAMMGPLTNE